MDFWKKVDSTYYEDASAGVGCYIFSIRAGKGALPWYVGMAEKQSFKKECFTPHKLNHYNYAIANKKGTPLITIIPRYTPNYKLCTPNGAGYNDIRKLETMLIAQCITRNQALLNIRDTKILREMVLPGFINNPQGKPKKEVVDFKCLLGV